MYSREKVELFLLATEDGMGPTAAAEFAGVTVSAAKKWATGHLPRSYTGGGCVSVNIFFTIFTNVFSPIAPTRMRRIRQRGCAAFGV